MVTQLALTKIRYVLYTVLVYSNKNKMKNKKKTKRGVAHNALFHLWWSWQHFNRPIKCNWKKFTHDYKVDHSWRRWRNLYTPIPHTTKNTHTRIFHKFPPAVIILQVKKEGGKNSLAVWAPSNLINCFPKFINAVHTKLEANRERKKLSQLVVHVCRITQSHVYSNSAYTHTQVRLSNCRKFEGQEGDPREILRGHRSTKYIKQEPDVNTEMSAGGKERERWRDDNELLWKSPSSHTAAERREKTSLSKKRTRDNENLRIICAKK
jgi:hypothetical protein